jgi:hypothetical protein
LLIKIDLFFFLHLEGGGREREKKKKSAITSPDSCSEAHQIASDAYLDHSPVRLLEYKVSASHVLFFSG